MPGAHRQAAVVRLDATVDESGEENRMVMVDVTESHRQLARLLHAQGRDDGQTLHQPVSEAWWGQAPAPAWSGQARPGPY